MSVEELRREKDRIEREREEIERRLLEAERREREQLALTLLPQVIELTTRIDGLKQERNDLLNQLRDAAPQTGDFTYAAEDYRLTLQSARQTLKQPELLDRLVVALTELRIHVEPRAPKFRLFRDLHAIGSLHVGSRRVSIAAIDAVLAPDIIQDAEEINAQYPGLIAIEYASEKRERRVREGAAERLPNGDFALSITFHASDTGSFDTVLPIALRALEHVSAFRASLTPEEQARLFEPWTSDSTPAIATPGSSPGRGTAETIVESAPAVTANPATTSDAQAASRSLFDRGDATAASANSETLASAAAIEKAPRSKSARKSASPKAPSSDAAMLDGAASAALPVAAAESSRE